LPDHNEAALLAFPSQGMQMEALRTHNFGVPAPPDRIQAVLTPDKLN